MNAPRELANLLSSWAQTVSGQSIYALHGGDEPDAWRNHVHAMDLVAQVGKILASMEAAGRSVDHYRRTEAAWVRGIVVPDRLWGESGAHLYRAVEQTTIDQLMALADVVDGESDKFQVAEPMRLQSLEALDDFIDLLGNPDELPLSEFQRRYAFELISSVRGLLEEASTFNNADIARRIHELIGYLNVLADEAEDAGRGAVAVVLRNIGRKVRPYVVGGALIFVNAIGAAANMKAIGS